MTPNTTRLPAAAPSAASLSAKQLASFWTRTGRPSLASMSRSKRWPLSALEFAFLTRPVAGLMTPGMPTPTVAVTPSSRFGRPHQRRDRVECGLIARGRRNPAAERQRAVRREDRDLGLGAAKVDADAMPGHACKSDGREGLAQGSIESEDAPSGRAGMSESLLDVKGMSCPLPVLRANRELRGLKPGERLRVLATDRAAIADFQAFCRETGHALLAWSEEGGVFSFLIRRRADERNGDA